MRIQARLFIFISGLIVLFSSCKKDTAEAPLAFKFIGCKDTSASNGATIIRNIQVLYLGGTDGEQVTFKTVNVPAGMTISYSPESAVPGKYVTQQIYISAAIAAGNYILTAIATGARGYIYKRDFNITVNEPFNHAPIIYLNGNTQYKQVLNTPYVEPGFAASDVEDGNLTNQVITYGSVNTDSTGIYYISYVVSDSKGKKDSVVRTVTVKNDASFVSGQFTCNTLTISSGLVHNWIASTDASATQNNHFTIFKYSDCFPSTPDLYWDPSTDSIYLPPQSFTCSRPGETTLLHQFSGRGKLANNGSVVKMRIDYTDSYTDPVSGLSVTMSLRDSLIK